MGKVCNMEKILSVLENIKGYLPLIRLADLLEQGKLFVSDVQCAWMCLNCGYIFEGAAAPKVCPVCQHDQGFFVRLEMAPFGDAVLKK